MGMRRQNDVLIVGIPTTEAQVKTANTSSMVIHNDDLLVMGP